MSNSEQLGTQVSSFVDGEMAQAETELLIKRLGKDEQLQSQWRYYHLISDTLKNQLPERLDADFAARVSMAIHDESVYTHSAARRASFLKTIAGVAVAASVATLGIGAVLLVAQQDGLTNPSGMMAQSQQPAEKIVFAASGQSGGNEAMVLVDAHQSANPPMDSRMNKYLVNHSEYAVGVNMQSVLPYARIVGQPVK